MNGSPEIHQRFIRRYTRSFIFKVIKHTCNDKFPSLLRAYKGIPTLSALCLSQMKLNEIEHPFSTEDYYISKARVKSFRIINPPSMKYWYNNLVDMLLHQHQNNFCLLLLYLHEELKQKIKKIY